VNLLKLNEKNFKKESMKWLVGFSKVKNMDN
jgi:hypothetical protein